MELTKAQRNFFADLDLDKALAAGDGKVHFDFHHKGHTIAVEAYCSCDADIIVRRPNPHLHHHTTVPQRAYSSQPSGSGGRNQLSMV